MNELIMYDPNFVIGVVIGVVIGGVIGAAFVILKKVIKMHKRRKRLLGYLEELGFDLDMVWPIQEPTSPYTVHPMSPYVIRLKDYSTRYFEELILETISEEHKENEKLQKIIQFCLGE